MGHCCLRRLNCGDLISWQSWWLDCKRLLHKPVNLLIKHTCCFNVQKILLDKLLSVNNELHGTNFPCVSAEVRVQVTRLIKSLVTLCTLIWLFTCVSTEVLGQITRVGKRLVTMCTLIRRFTCLSTEVCGQLLSQPKCPVKLCFIQRAKSLISGHTGVSVKIIEWHELRSTLFTFPIWLHSGPGGTVVPLVSL